MSLLFDEESGSDSEVETLEASKPAEVPTTNGHGLEDEPISPRNDVASPSSSVNEVTLSDELPPRYGGVEEEEKESRDDIKVTVMGYQKAAEDYTFDVEVVVNEKRSTIHRTYKEVLWLHRNLARRVELGGNILPPLPPPPPKAVDVKLVLIGKDSRALYGDHSRLHCLWVESFLQALADHRFFSENNTVHTYLVNKDQIEPEEKLGSGSLWSSFTKSISDMQKSGIQDTEEEFSKFLKNVEELSPKLQDAAKAFSNMVSNQQGMSVSEFLLAEMLWEHSNWCKDKNSCCSSVFDKLAGAVNEEKEYLIASSYDGRHTLGFTFELYHAYCTQAKEMLYRRLDKLQTLFSCTATLDKAKPEKKAAAQVAKDDADRAFKAISETAKREIEEYTVQYASAFRENLISFTQAQIHHSKQTHNHLSRLRDELLRVEMTETAAD